MFDEARPADSIVRADVIGSLTTDLAALASARVGVDAVHIPTWAAMLERTGPLLAKRVYTAQELKFANARNDRLATRLAAKEAVLKVLGTGIRRGISLQDIEVISTPEGMPTIMLHPSAEERRKALQLGPVAVSLCHEEDTAYAVAIAMPMTHV